MTNIYTAEEDTCYCRNGINKFGMALVSGHVGVQEWL